MPRNTNEKVTVISKTKNLFAITCHDFFFFYSCTHVAAHISKTSHIFAIVGSLNIYIKIICYPQFLTLGALQLVGRSGR